MQTVLPCKQLASLRQEWSKLSSPSSTAMGCWARGTKRNASCVDPFALLSPAWMQGWWSSPSATRDSVVTTAAITSTTEDIGAASLQSLWASLFSNPATGSPGPFLHVAHRFSGPDPRCSLHTPSSAPSHCPQSRHPHKIPAAGLSQVWDPLWSCQGGPAPPGHCDSPNTCGYSLQHPPLPVHPMVMGGAYIYPQWFRVMDLLDHEGCSIFTSKKPSQIRPYFKPERFHSRTHSCAPDGISGAC